MQLTSSLVFASCSTNDGNDRAANRQQVETKSLKESGRIEMLLEKVPESQGRAERETDRDKGQIFGGNNKVQGKNRRGDALMCCLLKGSLRLLFDSLPISHTIPLIQLPWD